MAIKVILKQDVPNLGHAGDLKQVTPGYYRNYLLPRGLAMEATQGNISSLNANKNVRDARKSRELEQASAAARHLETLTLRIPVKLGEQGRIYGSVTNKDIADALQQQASLTVDRHKIDLKEPLKAIGTHSVQVRLEQGVDASVQVELVPEGEPVEA